VQSLTAFGIGTGIGVAIVIAVDIDFMSQLRSMRRFQDLPGIRCRFRYRFGGRCSAVLSAFRHFNKTPERRGLSGSRGQRPRFEPAI